LGRRKRWWPREIEIEIEIEIDIIGNKVVIR
jgi:hypothetical protein